MIWNLLILLVVGFVVYAVWTNYRSTPSDKGVFGRVLLALAAGATAAGAWVMKALETGGIPG